MNKTSFPKVQDKGEASASVVFSAQIKFSLFPDEDGSVEVKDVACGFKITSLDVKVLSGNLKMLYKMLVSVFQEKLTSSVESDLAGPIRKTLPMLRTLLVVACATFGGALPMSYRHCAVSCPVERAAGSPAADPVHRRRGCLRSKACPYIHPQRGIASANRRATPVRPPCDLRTGAP